MLDERLLQFDYEWRTGNREIAIGIAKEFINDTRAGLEPELSKRTLPELVELVEGYREAKNLSDRIIADMWILSEYPLQSVVGAAAVTVKIPRATIGGDNLLPFRVV